MFNWLFSKPLQIKFFVSSTLLISAALMVLMFNVFQVMNMFLSHQIKDDMQHRSHILAMTLMVGNSLKKMNDLQQLLHDVSVMHGYCYLTVLDTEGKVLASSGNMSSQRKGVGGTTLANEHSDCSEGSIPLVRDNKSFGDLYYGVDTSYFNTVVNNLRTKLIVIAFMWFVVGSVVYFFLVRKLVKPLQEITIACESMAYGNLNAIMPKKLPQDELGKLAVSFSNMTIALRERIESQQSYARTLYAEQARLNALITILPVGIMFVDHQHQVQLINQECRRLWGLSDSEDFVGMRDTELIEYAHNSMKNPDVFFQHLGVAIKEFESSAPFDTMLRSGKVIRSRSLVVPDAAENRYIGRIWMFEDVTSEISILN